MRKPSIYYVHLWGSWFCSTGVGLPGEPGEGATPKEAFVDWYIKQIGEYLIINQVENDLPISAEDLWDMYL